MRKEVADLLRINKQESARIRVEGVIRENLMLQACSPRLAALKIKLLGHFFYIVLQCQLLCHVSICHMSDMT